MSRKILISVAILSAATLLLESTFLRLLSVAQFYHFAFLVVSLALLGFGASGTILTLSSRLRAYRIERVLALSAGLFCLGLLVAVGVINFLPFDSYQIAWSPGQILNFVVYFFALTLPFICAGLGLGGALLGSQGQSHQVYAANLLGSGSGAALGLLAMRFVGVPGALLSSGLCALAVILLLFGRKFWYLSGLFVMGLLGLVWMGVINYQGRSPVGLTISPYKPLAYARLVPGAEQLMGTWGEISRLDVLKQAGVRTFPGLSYAYLGDLPEQYTLFRDADSAQPVHLVTPEVFEALAYLPESIAFHFRPGGEVLVLNPGGGLGVHQAIAGGAQRVSAVLQDPKMLSVIQQSAPDTSIYQHARTRVVIADTRPYLESDPDHYDVILLPLTDPYRPVTSGSFSLSEEFDLTLEALQAMIQKLAPGGILVTSRWLQTPPSEGLRMVGTIIEATDRAGFRPAEAVVAFRGIQTITILLRPAGWQDSELAHLRGLLNDLNFDLLWAPDMEPQEANRHNRLPEAVYADEIRKMIQATDRAAYFQDYPYDIRPATDNQPFFFHFFKWEQTPQVVAELGKKWLPFGGSGYLVLFAMLGLVVVLSGLLILAPLLIRSGMGGGYQRPFPRLAILLYFAAIGLAFLFVEIPIIQSWILLLGRPVYAFSFVVVVLLVFSGFGSWASRLPWLRQSRSLATLVVLAFLAVVLLNFVQPLLLSWPDALRLVAGTILLAPLGFFMGLPFPLGIERLELEDSRAVAWAWAVNGCASVVAGVLAAILALTYGFSMVVLLGAGGYGVAWGIYRWSFSGGIVD